MKNKCHKQQSFDYLSRRKALRKELKISGIEAENLDAEIRSFIAHYGDEKNNVKQGIQRLLPEHIRDKQQIDVEKSCDVIAELYIKHNAHWMWQEDLFCVIAYVFTLLSLVIDALDLGEVFVPKEGVDSELQIISLLQVLSILFVFIVWLIFDYFVRGQRNPKAWFVVLNRFMPSFTMVVYLLYYGLKFFYTLNACGIYIIVMVFVLLGYIGMGVWQAIYAHRIYERVRDKFESNDIENSENRN